MNTEALAVVEDPESYSSYISRLNNKRKLEKNLSFKEKYKPGSGNIWHRMSKNYDNSYDYTNHELSQSNLLSKKVNLINLYSFQSPSQKYLQTEIKPSKTNKIPSKKNKEIPLNKDKFYDKYYKKNINDNSVLNINNPNDTPMEEQKDLIKIEKNIPFGDALDILHSQLFSFKLDNEDI